jgi:GTPase SAR1 family protein
MEKNCNRGTGNYVLAIAGNKCDIDDSKKQITMKQASELAKELKSIFHETSAMSGEGVNELFMELIKKLILCIRKRDS